MKTRPQLFEFILDILSNPCFSSIMSWEGSNGQFVIKRPDTVARLWGERNCRRNMTYPKFCRALRYYYHKEVLTKIRGRKFTYKFDLHELQRRYGFKRILLPVTRESADTSNFPLPATRVCATDVFPAIATHAFTTGTHASDLFPATSVHAVATDVFPETAVYAANGFLASSSMTDDTHSTRKPLDVFFCLPLIGGQAE